MPIRAALAAALSLAISPFTLAQQEVKLKVGDAPPEISVDEWVAGEGPGSFDSSRVYLVEFWATWCGPCRQSIPHLNELHEKHFDEGLTILGISDEKPEVVKPWVQAKGAGMSYLVGIDSDRSMHQAWMEAAGQKGIPCVFVVGKNGKVVHIGNPLDPTFDDIVLACLKGRYDPQVQAKAKPILEAGRRAAKVKNFREAYRFFDEAIALDPKVMAPAALERYRIQLVEEKNVEQAAKYGRSLLQSYSEDPVFLGELAEAIVIDPDLLPRDLELAAAAAAAMIKIAGRDSPQFLARLATVQFHTGDVNAAIESQMAAWMAASKADKADFKRKLDSYRAAQRTKGGASADATGEPK